MRLIGGMTWPEEGNPAFLCIVEEKTVREEETLDSQREYFTVSMEFSSQSIPGLFDKIKDIRNIDKIYIKSDNKYRNYIRDFMTWKREQNMNIKLSGSSTISFEAGVLKIKELIAKKVLFFKPESIVKSQLQIFSKMSLKEETSFYAVSALTQVINSLQKKTSPEKEKTSENERPLSIKNWY